MTYRVLVTGSRAWPDEATVEEALEEVRALGALVVVHGACPSGADAMASRWARRRSLVTEERHPALWRERGVYNPQAGLARNRRMAESGADLCLSFIFRGSAGARHCTMLAEAAGIETRRFTL